MRIRKDNLNTKILECALSLLEPCETSLIYSDVVIRLFEGVQALPLRLLGDYDKLVTLAKMRAFYHRKQRPWVM